jgi:6-pyruvoyl-tetrahydropterin synthase
MKTRPNIQILKSNQNFFKEDKENFEDYCEITNSASTAASLKKKKWRRKRKNTCQVQVLIDEYNKSPVWTKEQVVELAEKTGLSEAQVYKWGWDYKKKLRKQALQFNIAELMCYEIIAPSKIDLEMIELQRNYKEMYSGLNAIVPTQLFF